MVFDGPYMISGGPYMVHDRPYMVHDGPHMVIEGLYMASVSGGVETVSFLTFTMKPMWNTG